MWSHLKDKSIIIPKISWEEIDKKVEPVLRKMEQTGILVDVSIFEKLAKQSEEKLKILEKQIFKLAKGEFNISSPSQMAEVLFTKLKISTEGLKKTKTGISTAANELQKIEGKSKIIKLILEYREINKLLTTYLRPLPKLADKNGRLHTSYGQDTSTGRITSNNPNLQNIPIKGEMGGEVRRAFIASPGMELISADYSQIELRVVACLAEDEAMIEAFRKGEDIHTRTASEIFNVPIDKVTYDQRRVAKTVNFGIVYGQSPYGLAQTLKIDQKTAAEYINKYFQKHTGIKRYVDDVIAKAKKQGYVETLFGFRRALPNINSHDWPLASSEERMAINMPVQGTAAEILKLAMIDLDQKIDQMTNDKCQISNKNLNTKYQIQNTASVRMLLTVHDELVVEVPKKDVAKVAQLIKESMENVIKLCVPVVVEVEAGPNWGEGENLDL